MRIHSRHQPKAWAAGLVTLAFVVAACGGDDDDDEAADSATTAASEETAAETTAAASEETTAPREHGAHRGDGRVGHDGRRGRRV